MMNTARSAVLACALLGSACGGADAMPASEPAENTEPTARHCRARDVVRSGHRGSGRKAADNPWPENTLPSFLAAQDAGADSVEVDVTYSADGVLVASHDDTVDRTTGATGCVGELGLAELRELDAARGTDLAGSGVTLPTLAEVLAAVDIDVNIEIKAAEPPCPVPDLERLADDVSAAIAVDTKPREIITSSFSAEVLSLLAPGIYRVLHRRNPQLAESLGFEAVNVKPDEHVADSIATAHDHGLDTLTVTADAQPIRDALAAGIDIILTDDLELVAELQDEACAELE